MIHARPTVNGNYIRQTPFTSKGRLVYSISKALMCIMELNFNTILQTSTIGNYSFENTKFCF